MEKEPTCSLNADEVIFDFNDEIDFQESYPQKTNALKTQTIHLKQPIYLDLHNSTLKEAREKLLNLVVFCKKEKIKKVRIITGKGLHSREGGPVIKKFVLDYLNSQPNIKWKMAQPKRGGSGVFEVKLP